MVVNTHARTQDSINKGNEQVHLVATSVYNISENGRRAARGQALRGGVSTYARKQIYEPMYNRRYTGLPADRYAVKSS